MAEINLRIGRNIRKKRLEKGLYGYQLAEKVGISKTHMYALETGQNRVGIATIDRIAKALDCDVADLMEKEAE